MGVPEEQVAGAAEVPVVLVEGIEHYPMQPRTITWEDILHSSMRRARDQLARGGTALTFSDLPAINQAYATDPPLVPKSEFDALPSHDEQQALVYMYMDAALERAMLRVGIQLREAGVERPVTDTSYAQVTPDPIAWPNGTVFQRTLETVTMALEQQDKIEEILAASGHMMPRSLPELGLLFPEEDVAEMFKIGLSTLRGWRTKHTHFEYVKFPGQRGAVRYTQRGLIAFAMRHLTVADGNTPQSS